MKRNPKKAWSILKRFLNKESSSPMQLEGENGMLEVCEVARGWNAQVKSLTSPCGQIFSIHAISTISTSVMPSRKKQKINLSSPVPTQSMDDKDPPVPASLFSSSSSSSPFPSRVSQDPHTVHLCKSLLSLPEQLEQLESGRYADENDSGSGVFEVNIDRLRGSVEVRRLREIPRGLKSAAREARECVADLIAKRKQDIAILEQDSASLNTRMEKSEDEALFKQLCGIRKMIGKYKDELWELERKYTVEVEVEVERVSTRVEVVKEESVKVEKEKKLLPLTDVGIYVLAGYGGRHDATLLTIERYDASQNSWTEVAASMSCARHCHASAVIGHDIYAIGGSKYRDR
eukprot:g76876.t1